MSLRALKLRTGAARLAPGAARIADRAARPGVRFDLSANQQTRARYGLAFSLRRCDDRKCRGIPHAVRLGHAIMNHRRILAAQHCSQERRERLIANTALCVDLHLELIKSLRAAERAFSERISKCQALLD